METQIKIPIYRGLKLGTENEYVAGNLVEFDNEYFIVKDTEGCYLASDCFHYLPYNEIDPTTLSIHFSNMLDSQGNEIFASLQKDGKGGDLVGYVDGHINYNVAERYVISEDGVLFLRDIIPNIKKYTLDKEIASWYKIYGIQQ